MSKPLIIVESPAKIKTLKKFLGDQFLIASSVGHIRDLPSKGFGIDVEHNFEPQYELLPEKKEVIRNLQKEAKHCSVVYLAPDPDREGEAIAWHIASILPKGVPYQRTTFNAITKEAVLDALKHPREIDIDLVNAQQARRLLDRIVGYKISPLLSRKLHQRSGISAGRVQSVALKLVVDREKEIEAFSPIEYWSLGAMLRNGDPSKVFSSRLHLIEGKKVEKELNPGKEGITIPNQETATSIAQRLERASYTVASVEAKEKKRNPEPPFITSTLQQEAARHFRFSSNRTMSIAQSLYEGVDLGKEGAEGLITYMRTDSVRIAPEALTDVRNYIQHTLGAEYLPESARFYSSKKSAQDAHEAIRPTRIDFSPERLKRYLNREQFLLYSLIWNRFVASQMTSALYDTMTVDIDTDQEIQLRATGSVLRFRGFLSLYEEKEDDLLNEDSRPLPVMEVGQTLTLVEVLQEQCFTKPPPRFTEASLVKELEKSGIGRPSTYAAIMSKIQSRAYTTKENHRLKPTELGCVIAEFLETNFKTIMNIRFTAEMEDQLELIGENKKDWKGLIREFWDDFIPVVDQVQKEAYIPKVMTEIPCPQCGEGHLQKIWSKKGYFHGCSRYPDCDYTASLQEQSFDRNEYAEDFNWDQTCPLCTSPMKVRHGKYGAFLGCTGYPQCKGLISIPKKGASSAALPQDSSPCPAQGCIGKIIPKNSRLGKVFYSCSEYPACDVIVNDLAELHTKYVHHVKTAYERKSARGKLTPSSELAQLIGHDSVTRGEAVKKVWDYIKSQGCQDPKDKRTIVPDRALAAFFGSEEPINMFQLSGKISAHLKSGGAASQSTRSADSYKTKQPTRKRRKKS